MSNVRSALQRSRTDTGDAIMRLAGYTDDPDLKPGQRRSLQAILGNLIKADDQIAAMLEKLS